MKSVPELLNAALSCHQAGRLDEAASGYEEVLRHEPNQADAIHLLGVVAHQMGQNQAAIERLREAVALQPSAVPFHDDLATVCLAEGRLEDAAACYRQITRLQPEQVDAHNNLGCALARLGDWEGAAAAFRRVLELRPDYAKAHNNLGNVLHSLERCKEAIASYRRAIMCNPDYPEAYNNLGVSLRTDGQYDAAVAMLRRALELRPDWDEARANLATALTHQEKMDEAAACYDAMNPASLAGQLGRLERAALWPGIVEDRAELDAVRRRLLEELNRLSGGKGARHLLCEAPEGPFRQKVPGTFSAGRERIPVDTLVVAGCFPPFNLQFDHENVRPIKEAYADWFARHIPVQPVQRPSGRAGQRGRVGFVLTDRFEVPFLKALGGVLGRLDTERIEPVVLCRSAAVDRVRQAIGRDSLQIVPLDPPLAKMAQVVRETACDVLYYREIGLDALGYCLPLMRLAPVQCTSAGVQVTSGMRQVDYYLSSAAVEPEDAAEHYTEKLILAETLLTWRRRVALPQQVKTREDFGLSASDHVYVCAQHLSKFHPDFDPLLAGILREDRQGKIVVTADPIGYRTERLRQRWTRTIPDVAERIFMLSHLETDDYLCLLAAGDVLLDPPHFDGLNSTYDGFSLGRAIVTCPGRFRRGRFTTGCYRQMELDDLVARDADDYVRRAVRLATEPDHRREVEERIAQASDVLFEDDRAVAEHERIFEQLVEEARQR